MGTPGSSAVAFATDSYRIEPHVKVDRATAFATLIVTLLAIGVVIFGGWDISARRDLALDVAMRSADGRLPTPRFADPSPFAVWLSSDLHVHDSIRRGELPLWDRSQGGGYSPLSYFQGGVLHPLRLATAAVPRQSVPSVLILLAVAAQFLGTYLVARNVARCAPVAAIASALVSICGSYFLSLIHYSGALLAFVHTPWLVYAFHRWLLRPSRWRWSGIILVASLLLLSGHPSFIMAAGICATLFGIVQLWGRDLRLWLYAALVPVVSVLAAAFATLPFVLAFRIAWSYKFDHPAYEVLTIGEWIAALSWILFDDGFALRTIDYGAFYAYVGPVAIALAVVGIRRLRKESRTAVAILAGIIGGFLVAVPGPWMSPLASVVPLKFAKGWYLFGVPFFFMTLAVAAGVDQLRSVPARLARWLPLAAIILLTVPSTSRVMTVFDPAPLHARPLASDATRFLRSQEGVFRITGLGGQLLLPNAGVWSGTEDLRITAPMMSSRYLRWLELADPKGSRFSEATLKQNLEVSPMLGAFNVAYVLQGKVPFRTADSWIPKEGVQPPMKERPGEKGYERPQEIDDRRIPIVFENEHLRIYRNTLGFRPRAWLTGDSISVADAEEAGRLLASNLSLSASSPVVETTSAPAYDGSSSFSWRTVLRVPAHSEAEIVVDSSRPALLILNEAFDPGWSVTVDGRKAAIHPVNLIARGTFVPAGRSVVRFDYLPPGFLFGAIVSALTILALCIFAASAPS